MMIDGLYDEEDFSDASNDTTSEWISFEPWPYDTSRQREVLNMEQRQHMKRQITDD